jgi:ABC-2 type transport system ATP-binding protein
MTGREFVTSLLLLHRFPAAEASVRAERALGTVDLLDAGDRLIRAYSRGMRQRLKFAQAIAHDPEIVILDEPLNGLDPLGKRKLIRLVREFRGEGRTIIISSHVLPEIEALTRNIVLIHQGKIFARGDIHEIRDLIDTHPHLVSIRCPEPRALAARFLADAHVLKVDFQADGRSLLVETNNRDAFFSRLGRLIAGEGLEIEEITSPDDNLQAVFDYLVGK